MSDGPHTERDAFRAALGIVVSAVVFLLAYPHVHARVDVLRDHARTYRDPLARLSAGGPSAPPAVPIADVPSPSTAASTRADSCAVAAVDTAVAPAAVGMVWPVSSRSRGEDRLGAFFAALARADTAGGTARIAWYGDSQIEGDLVTQTVRRRLQARFGGEGVGFVPVASVAAKHRASIVHEFSGDWKRFSVDRKPHPFNAVGVNGEYFAANPYLGDEPRLWVTYRAGRPKGSRLCTERTRFFYGVPRDTNASHAPPPPCLVEIVGDDSTCVRVLGGAEVVNEALLWDGGLDELTARWNEPVARPLYGFSFEGGPGLYLDNHATRGSAGAALSYVEPEVMKAFQRRLHYDLVVLQFGLNLIQDGPGDVSWYERAMTVTVRRLQHAMPEASILVVSIGDKSVKNEYGELVTDPAVPAILDIQRRVAERCDVAFFDMYAAMGGAGTLRRWVEHDPPLANRDYTHVNWRGSLKLAGLIHEFLMDAYAKHERKTG